MRGLKGRARHRRSCRNAPLRQPSTPTPPRPLALRNKELVRLLPLWPHEIADGSPEARQRLIGKIERTLRAERRRGLAGDWTYNLSRHMQLLRAWREEVAALAYSKAHPSGPPAAANEKGRQ